MRSLPPNSAAKRSGSGCPARDSAASRSPAAQPSVRSYSSASAESDNGTPTASSSARASVVLNRRPAVRISVSSPARRSRCRPSRRSWRVTRTNRKAGGARMISSSSWRSASGEHNSCRSSMTSQTRSSSEARSSSSRSTGCQPSRSGAAVSPRTSADPTAVSRSAPVTETHSRCGSRSSAGTVTQAAHPARPDSVIQDRSKTVLPLPGGADTCTTRCASVSRWNRPGRETTPSRTAGAAGASTAPDQAASSTADLLGRPRSNSTPRRSRITPPCEASSPSRP